MHKNAPHLRFKALLEILQKHQLVLHAYVHTYMQVVQADISISYLGKHESDTHMTTTFKRKIKTQMQNSWHIVLSNG